MYRPENKEEQQNTGESIDGKEEKHNIFLWWSLYVKVGSDGTRHSEIRLVPFNSLGIKGMLEAIFW